MLLDSLEDVLMLSQLAFALLERLSMSCCHYSRYIFGQQRKFFTSLECILAWKRVIRSGHAIIRWIIGVKLSQRHPTDEELISWNRPKLSKQLYHHEDSRWPKKILNFNMEGPASHGRPKSRWSNVINAYLRKKGIQVKMTKVQNGEMSSSQEENTQLMDSYLLQDNQ